MSRTTTVLLALALTLQYARAAAAQGGESLSARIGDAVRVYEADWVLKSSQAFPYVETLGYEPLSFEWVAGKDYVFAEVLIHTTEDAAALSLKNENVRQGGHGKISPSGVRGLGDDAYEWKGAGLFDKDLGYYFRKGKVVVLINSSSKSAAKRFAVRIANQL